MRSSCIVLPFLAASVLAAPPPVTDPTFMQAAVVIGAVDVLADECERSGGFSPAQRRIIDEWTRSQGVDRLRARLPELATQATAQQQVMQAVNPIVQGLRGQGLAACPAATSTPRNGQARRAGQHRLPLAGDDGHRGFHRARDLPGAAAAVGRTGARRRSARNPRRPRGTPCRESGILDRLAAQRWQGRTADQRRLEAAALPDHLTRTAGQSATERAGSRAAAAAAAPRPSATPASPRPTHAGRAASAIGWKDSRSSSTTTMAARSGASSSSIRPTPARRCGWTGKATCSVAERGARAWDWRPSGQERSRAERNRGKHGVHASRAIETSHVWARKNLLPRAGARTDNGHCQRSRRAAHDPA
mgnify:CR=1 FL=1